MKTVLKIIFMIMILITDYSFAGSIYGTNELHSLHTFDHITTKRDFLDYLIYNQIQALKNNGDMDDFYRADASNKQAFNIIVNQCQGQDFCISKARIDDLRRQNITNTMSKQWMSDADFYPILSSHTNDGKHLFETYSDGKHKIGFVYDCKILDTIHPYNSKSYNYTVCFVNDIRIGA